MAEQLVLICNGCGKGFLAMPPGSVDLDPMWRWLGGNLEGGVCGGAVMAVDYWTATTKADMTDLSALRGTANGKDSS